MALMREGMRRGLVQPKIVMQRVPAQIKRQLQSNPFLAPFASQPPVLRNEAKLVTETAVFPALRRFARFLETKYLPACYDGAGVWQAPEGARLYAYFARSFTTTALTRDEIQALGLAEVARIRDEMHSVQRKVGFPGTLAEFFRSSANCRGCPTASNRFRPKSRPIPRRPTTRPRPGTAPAPGCILSTCIRPGCGPSGR